MVFAKIAFVCIAVLFLAEENITAAKTVVYGKLGPLKLPFSVDQPDACKDQGITCPMIAGKEYTFKTVLPIKSMYPSVRINLFFWEGVGRKTHASVGIFSK